MVGRGRCGFTLMEAVVSLSISSALVALIGTVFLVQTNFYATQLQRTAAQDNARAVTELISRELRTTMDGGFVVANDTQLVVRSPISLAVVCATQGSSVHTFFDGGPANLDTLELSGVGVYNDTTATWSYYATTWSNIRENGNAAERCEGEASDTVEAYGHFQRLRRLATLHGSLPPIGTLLVFYGETEFVLTESTLDPGSIGLYRGTYGATLVEFASGMDVTAAFSYRRGGRNYHSPVPAAQLPTIDAVRLVATTRVRAQTGGRDDITAGWSVNVPLRNAN